MGGWAVGLCWALMLGLYVAFATQQECRFEPAQSNPPITIMHALTAPLAFPPTMAQVYSTSPPPPAPPGEGGSSDVGLALGVTFGGLAAIGIAVGSIVYYRSRRKKREEEGSGDEEAPTSGTGSSERPLAPSQRGSQEPSPPTSSKAGASGAARQANPLFGAGVLGTGGSVARSTGAGANPLYDTNKSSKSGLSEVPPASRGYAFDPLHLEQSGDSRGSRGSRASRGTRDSQGAAAANPLFTGNENLLDSPPVSPRAPENPLWQSTTGSDHEEEGELELR